MRLQRDAAKRRAPEACRSCGVVTMTDNPYKRFSNSELILRDELAIDRTILANERTVLSYLRGSVSLIIAGVTFVHFIVPGTLHYIGISFIPIGLVAGIFGVCRYRRMDKRIRAIRADIGSKTDQKGINDNQLHVHMKE
jgi:putative membrane protein